MFGALPETQHSLFGSEESLKMDEDLKKIGKNWEEMGKNKERNGDFEITGSFSVEIN